MDCTRKNHSKGIGKSTKPQKVLSSDWLTSKYLLCQCLGTLGSISALTEATLKEETTRCNHCRTLRADPRGLGSYICGIRIVSLAARFRTAASSGTLVSGLAKIRAARGYDGASIKALTPEWEERYMKT